MRTISEISLFLWLFSVIFLCSTASAGLSLSDVWASLFSLLAIFYAWRLLGKYWGGGSFELFAFIGVAATSLVMAYLSYYQATANYELSQLGNAIEIIERIEAENSLELPISNREELLLLRTPTSLVFFADGAVDEWAYIIFVSDFNDSYFHRIAVQEKGLLWIYVILSYMINDFNQIFFVLAAWIALIFSALLSVAIYTEIFDHQGQRIVFLLVAILPEFAHWAGLLHKDPFVVVFLLGILLGLTRFFIDGRLNWVPGISIGLVYLSVLRSGLFLPLFILVICVAALSKRSMWESVAFVFSIIIALVFFALIAPEPLVLEVNNNAILRPISKLLGGNDLLLDNHNLTYRGDIFEGASITRDYFNHDMSLRSLIFIPIHIISYFLYPLYDLPPQSSSGFFSFFGSTFFVLFSPFFFTSLAKYISSRNFHCLIVLPILIVGASIAFAGPFVLDRYRLILFPIYIIAVSSGWSLSKKKLPPLALGFFLFLLAILLPIAIF